MDLQIRTNTYSTLGQLDAFTQLHVARKLSPSMPIVQGLVSPANREKDKTVLVVMMLSRLPDADCEYVIRKCLGVVGRHEPNGPPAKVLDPAGKPMFSDMTMQDMLDLTIAVVEENLGDFFRTALASLDKEAQGTS